MAHLKRSIQVAVGCEGTPNSGLRVVRADGVRKLRCEMSTVFICLALFFE